MGNCGSQHGRSCRKITRSASSCPIEAKATSISAETFTACRVQMASSSEVLRQFIISLQVAIAARREKERDGTAGIERSVLERAASFFQSNRLQFEQRKARGTNMQVF